MRSQMPSFGKTNPLKEEHFKEFTDCYQNGDISKRRETYSDENPSGRWRKFTYEEILARDKTSLDIIWLDEKKREDEDLSLDELFRQIKEKSVNISQAVSELEKLLDDTTGASARNIKEE